MRGLSLLGALAALALAAANGINLLAWAYASLAERELDNPVAGHALTASEHAVALTPWSGKRLAMQGWIQAQRRERELAEDAYQRALRWHPADPLLWSEYALALARNGRFNGMEAAMQRSLELAPASPAVWNIVSSMGVSYWELGSEETQELWLRSFRRELRLDSRRFLTAVVTRGRTSTFCRGPAAELDLQWWCDVISGAARKCRDKAESPEEFALCISTK